MSDYYDNSTAGDILAGALFVPDFFLMTYKGYNNTDSRLATLGCVFAIGVTPCPITRSNYFIHIMHFVFAILLFSVCIFFCVYLFRNTDPAKKPSSQKEKRNRIYLVCGIIMIVCIAAISISMIWLLDLSIRYHLVFLFESLALIAFGISWVTKAEVLYLKDKEEKKD